MAMMRWILEYRLDVKNFEFLSLSVLMFVLISKGASKSKYFPLQ